MALPVVAGLPPALDLTAGYIVRVSAVDPTSGDLVSGVKIGSVVITASSPGGAGPQLQSGQFQLVPGPGA